jgi:phosphatidylserine/phosphatidylglycerophosphate/cardiolipin synthase-like enzyme
MVHTRNKLVAGLMALALCFGMVVDAQPALAGETDVYFSPNGGGAAAVVDLVDATTDTIDIGMYSVHTWKSDTLAAGESLEDVAQRWSTSVAKLREWNGLGPNESADTGDRLKVQAPIFGALERAVQRGVRVRMILNKGHLGSGKRKAQHLHDIGVQVFSLPKTIHQKFAIFDAGTNHAKLSNGSANWSVSADTKYSENTVVYHDHPHLVYQFQQEFNLLVSQSNTRKIPKGTTGHDTTPVVLQEPNLPAELWQERALFTSANILQDAPSQEGVVADVIIEAIRSAKHTILIDVAHFDSRPIANAVVKARWSNPSLDIQVLLDMGELSGYKGQARFAEQNGVSIRYKTYSLAYLQPKSQLMHHKTVIIDDELLITGSYNFSHTAEFKNYENTLVIRGAENQDLIDAFTAQHDLLWNMGRDVFPAFQAALRAQPGDANYKRILPLHFSSSYFNSIMTLTRSEVGSYYWDIVAPLGVPKARNYDYFDRETRQGYKPHPNENLGHFLTPDPAPTVGTGTFGTPAAGAAGVVNHVPGGN